MRWGRVFQAHFQISQRILVLRKLTLQPSATGNTMRTQTQLSSTFVLFCALWLVGCGGDSAEQSTAQVQNTPSAPASPEADYEAQMAQENYGGPGMSSAGDTNTPPPAPPRPPRPDDPAIWSSQQITSAIEERDLKVKDALIAYTESHRGEDQAAQEIVAWMEILKLPPVEPPKPQANNNGYGSSGYPGGSEGYPTGEGAYPEGSSDPAAYEGAMMEEEMYSGAGDYGQPNPNGKKSQKADDEIAEVLIDSLMGIQSLTSFQAARNLLEGEITISLDPERTARQIMTGLLQNIQSAYGPGAKIMRQTILDPALIRSGDGDFDSRRLQNISMEEHWKNAVAVMDGMMGVDSSKAGPPKPQPGQENYGYSDPSMEMSSGEGIGPDGQPMRKEDGNRPPARNPIPKNLRLPNYTQEQATAAKNYLWAPEMIDQITQRLTVSDTLMREPDLVMLAGQLPATASRHALQQYLEKNWKASDDWTRNPIDLVRHDAFKKFLRDPGLLVTVKSLPHEQINATGAGGGDYGSGEETGNAGASRPTDEDASERHSKGEWFKATEHLMIGLMDRMQLAASQNSLPVSDEKELDVRLHRKAELTMSSRLELVLGHQSADPKKPMPDKTTVNYARIELNSLTPQEGEAIVKHYRSALRNENVFTILNNNGMWMESSGRDRVSDELYSQDVLLSKSNSRKAIVPAGGERANSFESSTPSSEQYANPGGYENGEGGGQGGFVIEILTVRIPDPEEFLKPAEQPAVSQN